MQLRVLLLFLGLATASDALAGEYHSFTVLPHRNVLHGSKARQRLLVEKKNASEFIGAADSTITWHSENTSIAHVDDEGIVTPVGNGKTRVFATFDHENKTVRRAGEIEVVGLEKEFSWEFRRHVLSVLSKSGCNSGACHGALAGKGGFKLSLNGYNPLADHVSITQEAHGRRVELADPGRSLLIAKPSTALPHKGGLRLPRGSDDYALIAEWITAGAPAPLESDPTLKKLEVFPDAATLAIGDKQPLVVRATYSDGRQEDVTKWARFSSSNESAASVDDEGTVTILGPGKGAVVAWFSSQIVLFRMTVPYGDHVDPDTFANHPRRNFIDEHVLDQLERLRLKPSPRSSDHEFVRRVYLDVIGTLPTVQETRDFVLDERADKRDRLIETLLGRAEYVDFWTYKWSDLLLVNGRRLRPLAVKAYYVWIKNHVSKNTPWDEVVREIVTATGETEENGATNFYSLHQSPEEMTENVCQAFLSLSIGCAKCHNHPLEKWTNNQYYAMASHFARVRAKGWGGDGRNGDGLRTLFLSSSGELVQPTTGKPQPPTPLDGDPIDFDARGDRRRHLANWLTSPSNPYFARATANRIWANLLGIGIVNPVDDLRSSNPATNEPLLEALATYLVDHDFDLKMLMRLILQSETYQRTSHPLPGNASDQLFFSRYFPRRLTAEVLLDAIAQVSNVPTEFKQIGYDGADFVDTSEYPIGTRAIQLADSAVVSNFLKTFGRNERDITCECERSNTPSIVQVLHINNGVTINDRLASQKSCVAELLDKQTTAQDVVTEAYWKALSRSPSASELESLSALLDDASDDDRRQRIEDLYWSILSSREFLFNH